MRYWEKVLSRGNETEQKTSWRIKATLFQSISFYLWSPPEGRHQTIACLFGTLMSLNRPGTVSNMYIKLPEMKGLTCSVMFWWPYLPHIGNIWLNKPKFDTFLFIWSQFCARSHHRTEGVQQEDGVTIQQCFVSTTLCCLLRQFTHTQQHMSKQAFGRRKKSTNLLNIVLLHATPDMLI